MTPITIRVLDGADRGRVYEELVAPITIGREEGNSIQLNDERVSRYHLKIQEDHEKLVLTDLESTNGTKVNGEDIQLKILRYGDMIGVGRSVLLFGSRDQIAARLAKLKGETSGARAGLSGGSSQDFEVLKEWLEDPQLSAKLRDEELPQLPERLTPGQSAQLNELLEHVQSRIRVLTSAIKIDRKSQQVQLEMDQWQQLLDLQARLSELMRSIGEPSGGGF
jgi:hypothetical protein